MYAINGNCKQFELCPIMLGLTIHQLFNSLTINELCGVFYIYCLNIPTQQ